jgi:tyrosyl-tRNA synthetase
MEDTEIKYNSEWCKKLGAEGMIDLASKTTVARMLEREDFTKRYKSGVSISIHEFLYPLVQGYDSVALKSDLEIGGTDQKFNLLMGRELQRDFSQKAQCILTMPILEGLDGIEKMSKSKKNYIALTDSPDEMYGKIMSVSDDLMWRYMELLSLQSKKELNNIKKKSSEGLNPRDIKSNFALEIVERFHSKTAANSALEDFEKRFKLNELPTNLQEKFFNGDEFDLIFLLKNSGLVISSSEGFRLIQQGGIKINGEKVINRNTKLKKGSYVLQVGKRKIIKVKII